MLRATSRGACGFSQEIAHHPAEIGSPESRAGETIQRAARYRAAGANGLFVPGLSDPSEIKAIAPEVKMPLNVLAVSGLPLAKELKKLGVRRLSSGTGIPQMIWGRVAELAKSFLGTGDSKPIFEGSMPYGKLQTLRHCVGSQVSNSVEPATPAFKFQRFAFDDDLRQKAVFDREFRISGRCGKFVLLSSSGEIYCVCL